MLKNKSILGLILIFAISITGCSSDTGERNKIQLRNNQGIFFNVDGSLYPVYSIETTDSRNLVGKKLDSEDLKNSLTEIFLNEVKGQNRNINELNVGNDVKILINKNYIKPVLLNIIYSDEDRTTIIPYEWSEESYAQFDINNLTKDVTYHFQISYAKQDNQVIKDIDTYSFSVIFK